MTRKAKVSTRFTGRNEALIAALFCFALGAVGCSTGSRPETSGASGEELFLRRCAGCHPQGRNLLYPQKDLKRLTLVANGISTPQDIKRILRNPGKGMPQFGPAVISDAEALRIGTYVLETFR